MNNILVEKGKEIKGSVLKLLIIIVFIMMFITFNISLYLLIEVETIEGLQIIVCFIIAQIIGFIVFLILVAFFISYYEYNEYWASALSGRLDRIEKRLTDLLPLLESKD